MAEKTLVHNDNQDSAAPINGVVTLDQNGPTGHASSTEYGEVHGNPPTSTSGSGDVHQRKIRKLSSTRMFELASSPDFLPKTNALNGVGEAIVFDEEEKASGVADRSENGETHNHGYIEKGPRQTSLQRTLDDSRDVNPVLRSRKKAFSSTDGRVTPRTVSTPPLSRGNSNADANVPYKRSVPSYSAQRQRPEDEEMRVQTNKPEVQGPTGDGWLPSPMPRSVPAPPLSVPTYLELELSSERPSPLYLHHSIVNDFPYESSKIKIERLQNFLLLPIYLEPALWFGALACMDAWLYSFTILPLRFLKAMWILSQSWGIKIVEEARYLTDFNYKGIGRLWQRRRRSSVSEISSRTRMSAAYIRDDKHPSRTLRASFKTPEPKTQNGHARVPSRPPRSSKHHRTQSEPSALLPTHKADILNFLLILVSCAVLSRFDASRMYHTIRGQAAIKLYVIYNVLEVCDRLFSAIGQDVLECLFSKECLERKANGRSKVWRPLWLFSLALFYNVIHSMALFYQVITLNVAVNSYSNSLMTLLMSNQFVEIKSTVFKRFEKDNLFQITCADVVERFQLWLMLTVIAARNAVETGSLSLPLTDDLNSGASSSPTILPFSFTLLSDYSLKVLTPFFLVLGSEILVDNLKHAYITKFNNTRPAIYGRFLDLLAKDYYTNAFSPDQKNLTRRLGLPTIPLACLGIRASIQTYRMFIAIHFPPPAPSPSTSLVASSEPTPSPGTLVSVLRLALGHSTFGAATDAPPMFSRRYWMSLTSDDLISLVATAGIFIILFSLILLFKLLLGMVLLEYARIRYRGMKERECMDMDTKAQRVGGWGVVEVSDEKRRWIYKGEEDEWKARGGSGDNRTGSARPSDKGNDILSNVKRYDMVAKRIW